MSHFGKIIPIVLFSFVLCLIACGSASDDVAIGSSDSDDNNEELLSPDPLPSEDIFATPTPSLAPAGGKVWDVNEILNEPRSGGSGGTPKCGGEGGFARCLCPEDVPSTVRYRPAVTECNGNAAALFDGQYADIFSVVVRDSQNRDRWPASGFNGCSEALSTSESPPNRCSAFKVQDSFNPGGGSVTVYCFGASGYSDLFSDARRLTIKLADDPNSNDDPLERFCLSGPDLPLN